MPEVSACMHTRNIFSLILLAVYTLSGNYKGHKKEESTFHTVVPFMGLSFTTCEMVLSCKKGHAVPFPAYNTLHADKCI